MNRAERAARLSDQDLEDSLRVLQREALIRAVLRKGFDGEYFRSPAWAEIRREALKRTGEDPPA